MKPKSQRLGRHEERRPRSFTWDPGRYARRGAMWYIRGSAGARYRAFSRFSVRPRELQSRALNRAGVQPFRAVSARLIYRIAAAGRAGKLDDLSRRGFVILEDFLPPEEFTQLRDEAAEFAELGSPTSIDVDGASRCIRWNLPPDEPDQFPRLTEWTDQHAPDRARERSGATCAAATRGHAGARAPAPRRPQLA